jgi:outer membrane cobalamin receptor
MKYTLMASALAAMAFAFAPALVHAQDEPEEASQSRAKPRKADDRFCIQETGSRIVAARNARSKSDEKECVATGGRVYTREDIDSTGSVDIKDALRKLDPSIR